ncbi:MAG: 5'-3' exoribonuclease [Chlamydiae bacterium]|nr:5'-3' exoribonuclease [Chlamydiota bacterium]
MRGVMTETRYDLHSHSIYSDGSDSVVELFEEAVKQNLSGLSITDHDTIKAYSEALDKVKDYPLKLLPGVEISSQWQGDSVHILLYSFSPKDQKINIFIDSQQKEREERNRQILENLKKQGMPLELDKLKEDIGVIGRPHMAKAMMERGYVGSIREAFNRFLAEGELCFVPGKRPSVEDVLQIAKQTRAFAIIAHPHLIKSSKLLKALLALPFDGLEAYYAHFHLRDEKKWIQLADNRNWLKTGGSDFHGLHKPYISLGASWVSEDVFQLFYQRYLENEDLQRM